MALQIKEIDLFQIKTVARTIINKGLGNEGKVKTNQLNDIVIYVDGIPQQIKSATIKQTKVKIKTSKIEYKINL